MACGCEGAKCSLEPGDDRHGTTGGYTNRRCRCDACRDAKREYTKAYREAHGEAIREYGKAYRSVNRAAIREYSKVYRLANREAEREYMKAYCEVNREARREYYKAYCEAHPDVVHAGQARRRARKANAFIGPAFTRQQVWDRDNGTCHLCGGPANPLDWHMDHVIPLARGGAHSFENCAVSHPACNLRKGARLLDELDAACTISTVSH